MTSRETQATDVLHPQDGDIGALRARAARGDAGAMFQLGARLLVGDGVAPSLQEGAALIEAAGERDHAAALSMLATLAAAGVSAPPNWSAGFDHLAKAAALGSDVARAQIMLLAGGAPAPRAPAADA